VPVFVQIQETGWSLILGHRRTDGCGCGLRIRRSCLLLEEGLTTIHLKTEVSTASKCYFTIFCTNWRK